MWLFKKKTKSSESKFLVYNIPDEHAESIIKMVQSLDGGPLKKYQLWSRLNELIPEIKSKRAEFMYNGGWRPAVKVYESETGTSTD